MWKAALVTAVAGGALAFGLVQSATTYDGRSDPCAAVPEACEETTEPDTTTTSTTIAPASTTVTTLAPTTVPAP